MVADNPIDAPTDRAVKRSFQEPSTPQPAPTPPKTSKIGLLTLALAGVSACLDAFASVRGAAAVIKDAYSVAATTAPHRFLALVATIARIGRLLTPTRQDPPPSQETPTDDRS